MFLCVYKCACAFGGQKLMSVVFPDHSPFLRQDISWKL